MPGLVADNFGGICPDFFWKIEGDGRITRRPNVASEEK